MDPKQKKTLIFSALFTGIILAFVGFLYALIHGMLFEAFVLGLLLAFAYASTKYDILLQLNEYERAVVFRFGHCVGVRGPGWTIIIPFIERYVKVDLRTQTVDVKPQKVITKDNIEITVDAVIYMKVIDPYKSVINIDNYQEAARFYTTSEIREKIGGMTLEEVISETEKINVALKESLQRVAEKWGVKITAVEIQHVDIPEEVLKAMHERRKQEELKEARKWEAEAEKIKIEAVKEAVTDLSDKALAFYYIKALEQIASGQGTKIVLPLEISKLAENISSSLGGKIPPSVIERDLKEKYGHLLDAYIKGLNPGTDDKERKGRKKKK